MKNIKVKLLLILIAMLSFTVVIACSEDDGDDYCYSSVNTGIDSVAGPETGVVNEPILFEVTFGISSGCGKFVGFIESGFPKVISARVDYTGCVCTDIYQIMNEPYTFTAASAGVFELRFIKPDGTYITKTVTVTE